MSKVCSKCKKELDFKDFYVDKKGKNGLYSYCKNCQAKIMNDYYKKNKNKFIENAKKWKSKNLDKVKISSKKYNLEHKEEIRYYHKNQRLDVIKKFGNKCQICGYDKIPALEFHHERKKRYKQDYLINIKGVILICANCHRLIHYNNK